MSLITLSIAILLSAGEPGTFEALGTPVVKAGLMGTLVGPGPTDGSERIYFNFRQDGGKLFLVVVDPETGKSEQYPSPVGTGAWGFIIGPDQRIYLGTHEGPSPADSGQILVFDPRQPEKAIQVVGRPSPTETYLWMFANGDDGKIYGCTYAHAKLVSYDPKTGELADLGVMDDSQLYTRSICAGADGRIYIGVGYGRANVVVYDPKTGKHVGVLPDAYRKDPAQTVASVYAGVDAKVYASVTKMVAGDGGAMKPQAVTLVVNGDNLEETASPASAVSQTRFRDGRVVGGANLSGDYNITFPDGRVETHSFAYKGAGSGIFMVAPGPLGRIYGGTAMPCEMFWFDPATGKSENPGNPCEVGGEIYSMLDYHGALYCCAYPGSFLSKWDPTKPWDYGRNADNNPHGFGPLGVGHLRPRAMILGPDEKLYIGSYPEYGRLGGSLGVWDPTQDKLIENYHRLIENQSIATLVYDAKTSLVFGGSSTAGGGGSRPSEPDAKFFAFDPAKKMLAFEEVPTPGAQGIRTLVQVGRRLFGLAGDNHLFVYDIDTKEYVHKGPLSVKAVPDLSMGLWRDGQLYGLSKQEVFRLDPVSFQLTSLAKYERDIHCGFAMDEHGIYFGDRATLMRYNWPKPGGL